jgi:hypothetical protein
MNCDGTDDRSEDADNALGADLERHRDPIGGHDRCGVLIGYNRSEHVCLPWALGRHHQVTALLAKGKTADYGRRY